MNDDDTNRAFAVRVLLTVCALEFFGPILRDFSHSHALNPTWVGHARLHLVWLLGFMGLSGVMNVYLIWFRRTGGLANLWLSAAWQCCNLGGFWISYLLVPVYGGVVAVEGIHTSIFGIDENVFVFSILSILMVVALVALRRLGESHA
jgi:hypothetical protein